MHDVHIWPTDIHIHDTKSHGGQSISLILRQCFIPEISMIAKWDKESTLLHTTQCFKELLSLIVKTNQQHKKMTIDYTNNALLVTLRHLKQKGLWWI